ncbi:PhoH family protein [Tistrella mobilis]|uniref:PhoH-like protein n=1 Tax=Tistrella mobilis (strain KA081020-065) TaxID=1110502 RepID=I3TRI2_TISMK|nr:phosphate starvation-inducible protein PhoH-related protein [Tistrella mobilis KA081020-065]MAM72454.1 PhoH family protein [Tistrella sp.]
MAAERVAAADIDAVILDFDDNHLLALLVGEHDEHLVRIESQLGVHIVSRGNRLAIQGSESAQDAAADVLDGLYQRLKRNLIVTMAEVDAAIRMVTQAATAALGTEAVEIPPAEATTTVTHPAAGRNGDHGAQAGAYITGEVVIKTKKKRITPRSMRQGAYLSAIRDHDLVFGIGPAGTGKTYLAVAMAVALFLEKKVDRIILSRPAVEAGERLGFLPGTLEEKVNPYLRPLYDALQDTLPDDIVSKLIESGKIEVAPLAFMRGRTLSNAFVILDEAQNTTAVQMKMFLTRLGENSRMVITGDLSQIDLPAGTVSGLSDALSVLGRLKEVPVVTFDDTDVVRHPLVARIVRAYDARDEARRRPRRQAERGAVPAKAGEGTA